jgi:hypothetical protein
VDKPAQFRKQPIVVEAMQLTADTVDACIAFCGGVLASHPFVGVVIRTERGEKLTVRPGDWIIKGTKGELYPCEAATFAEIYEPVEPDEPDELIWKKPGDSVA